MPVHYTSIKLITVPKNQHMKNILVKYVLFGSGRRKKKSTLVGFLLFVWFFNKNQAKNRQFDLKHRMGKKEKSKRKIILWYFIRKWEEDIYPSILSQTVNLTCKRR